MSKWKQSYEAGRKYKHQWQKRYSWLERMSDGSENAFCTLCCKILQPKLSTINNHSRTSDHRIQQEYHTLETTPSTTSPINPPILWNGEEDDGDGDDDDDGGGGDDDDACGSDDDDRLFGVYVTNQLRYLSSEESRVKLRNIIREAVVHVAEVDSELCGGGGCGGDDDGDDCDDDDGGGGGDDDGGGGVDDGGDDGGDDDDGGGDGDTGLNKSKEQLLEKTQEMLDGEEDDDGGIEMC